MANLLQRLNISCVSIPYLSSRRHHFRVEAKVREICMPALSSSMVEGKIVSWLKSEGDHLSKGECVVVIESDENDIDVHSFHDGILAAIIVPKGIFTPVGSPIALLAESEADIALAKSLAMNSSVVSKKPKAAAVAAPPIVPFTTIQEAVNRIMVDSLSIPAFNVGYTITTTALLALYKKIKPKGVTITALITKATAMALTQHPVLNSCCRDGKSFTFNSSINIAVVVAIEGGGLVTPVLRDADKIDIYSLSKIWKELVHKARSKQLQPQECSTGTFTLSNLGMCGSVDRFDAILPPGTGAIMSVGASRPTVVGTKDGQVGIENQMQVTVTADHRIIYGADLAAFLYTLAQIIEDPKDLTF